MEHFYNPTTSANVTECLYNDESEINNPGCDSCFDSEICNFKNCVNVCGLDFSCDEDAIDCNTETIVNSIDLYKSLFNKVKKYVNEHKTLPDIQFNMSQIISFNEVFFRGELFDILKGLYNNNTEVSISNFVDKTRLDNILKSQERIINDDGIILNNLKNTDNTMKRKMEINLNEFRKIQYNLKVIKQAIVFVAIILIFPALVKFGVLDKQMGLVIWFICLVVLLIYVLFMIIIKNNNRDDIDFREYNFVKPTDEEIARSRIAASMSSKDKAKCKALAEMDDDFDANTINIDITPYKTNDKEVQCFDN